MMSEYTAIPLYFSNYRKKTPPLTVLPGTLTVPLTKEVWQDEMVEMVRSHMRGESVYVRYTDTDGKDSKRRGSIARIKFFHNFEYLVNGQSYYHYRSSQKAKIDPHTASEADIKPENMSLFRPQLVWDGRSNITNPEPYQIEWLKGYNGPTNWIFEEPVVPTVVAFDRLGREVKVGDFICYILHHFNQSGASIQFGKVSKITKAGEVYAKNIKLSDSEKSAEKKINDNRTIVIMTTDLMDQLMLARLSS